MWGGMAAGSFTTDSTEVFQEGLRFPAVKLVDGRRNQSDISGYDQINVRFPEAAEGHVGDRLHLSVQETRIIDLCEKYGKLLSVIMTRLLDQGEIMAKRLSRFPKGSWEMEEYMDDDGHGNLF